MSERRDPPFGGSVVFLLMNLPLGVVAFALLTSFTAAGLGTAVVWVGVGLLALLVLAVTGGRAAGAGAGLRAAGPVHRPSVPAVARR